MPCGTSHGQAATNVRSVRSTARIQGQRIISIARAPELDPARNNHEPSSPQERACRRHVGRAVRVAMSWVVSFILSWFKRESICVLEPINIGLWS